MPTTKTSAAPRALREEIENVLHGNPTTGRPAGTARWIASQVSAPVRTVREELEAMQLAGKITTRVTRGGDVLFKLIDRYFHQWSALRGPNHSHN